MMQIEHAVVLALLSFEAGIIFAALILHIILRNIERKDAERKGSEDAI